MAEAQVSPEGTLAEVSDQVRRIQATDHADHIKAALLAIAAGKSVQASSVEYDCERTYLWQLARRYKLVDTTPRGIRDRHARIATLSLMGLEDALANGTLDPEDAASASRIAVVGGISTDKVFAHDRAVAANDGSSAAELVAALAASLPSGTSAKLTLEVHASPQKSASHPDALEAEYVEVSQAYEDSCE